MPTEQEQMPCPHDGSEMVLRQAGVSTRTGRAYPAFWSCPMCQRTVNAVGTTPSRTSTPRPRGETPSERDASIRQAQDRREDSISKFNAINTAIELVKLIGWMKKSDEEKEEVLQEIYRLQEAIYQRHRTGF